MNMLAQKPRLIQTELGTEKLCICCGDYYPLDSEFFYTRKVNGKLRYEAPCKACYKVHYNKLGKSHCKYKIKSAHEVAA